MLRKKQLYISLAKMQAKKNVVYEESYPTQLNENSFLSMTGVY